MFFDPVTVRTAYKIRPYSELVDSPLARCNKLVITNGCFDILHSGHVAFLEECRSLGDLLFVGVNADWAVKAMKGHARPINQLQHRMRVLAGLSAVDYVCGIDDVNVAKFISDMKASIWVKGGDYTMESLNKYEVMAAGVVGTEIKIVQFVAGISTTGILARANA